MTDEDPRTYTFALAALPDALACFERRGFAVIQRFIETALVEALDRELLAMAEEVHGEDGPSSVWFWDYIERAPSAWELCGDERFTALIRRLLDAEEIALTRSVGLVRYPGDAPMGWHRDRSFRQGPPRTRDDVFLRAGWARGTAFYLSGSAPEEGGLTVIDGSHRADWAPPPAFGFLYNGRVLTRADDGKEPYRGMDLPGRVAVRCAPGDLVLFSAELFHTNMRHPGWEIRTSAALMFRPVDVPFEAPWGVTESAKAFIELAPPRLKPLVEGYPGCYPEYVLPKSMR